MVTGSFAGKPARLLFVTGTPATVRAGSGTYVGISVLRQALVEAGHEVDLVAPGGESAGILSRLAFNLAARQAASRGRYDAVVGFDLDGLFVSSGGAARIASVKGVIADELRFERGMTRLSMRLASKLEQVHVRRVGRVLTTSSYAAGRIAAEYGIEARKIHVVPEPIDLPRWDAALAACPPGQAGETAILCVAHLYPRKNVVALLRAMKLLKSGAKLRVVGVGPELSRLQALARELALGNRVAFLEHLPFELLVREYRSASVFCLPSLQEGFGIVFLEAMASGLPVVACKAAAVPEVVPDEECAILVEGGDVPAVARALDRLAGDVQERRRLGSAGRRRVARYDAAAVARQFLEAIGF